MRRVLEPRRTRTRRREVRPRRAWQAPLLRAPVMHAAVSATSAAGEAPVVGTALATLLAGHVLHDGETVLIMLRPSRWFVLLTSLGFIAGVLAVLIVTTLAGAPPTGRHRFVGELAVLAVLGRLGWATLHWLGRLYVLTDLRIIRLSGVFAVELFDCPLRKVAGVRRVDGSAERLLRLGTIDVVPQDPDCSGAAPGAWQMIRGAGRVHDQIVAALNRAKSGA